MFRFGFVVAGADGWYFFDDIVLFHWAFSSASATCAQVSLASLGFCIEQRSLAWFFYHQDAWSYSGLFHIINVDIFIIFVLLPAFCAGLLGLDWQALLWHLEFWWVSRATNTIWVPEGCELELCWLSLLHPEAFVAYAAILLQDAERVLLLLEALICLALLKAFLWVNQLVWFRTRPILRFLLLDAFVLWLLHLFLIVNALIDIHRFWSYLWVLALFLRGLHAFPSNKWPIVVACFCLVGVLIVNTSIQDVL